MLPLRLTDDQLDAVMRGAEPLPSQDRHKYLQRVAELLYQQGELAVNEAEYQAMELVVAEAAALEPHMTPQQAAELTVARARLKANHITLDQCYRSRRRIQAQRAWARIKGLLVLAFLVWLLITFARTAQAQSTTRSFYDGRGSFAGTRNTASDLQKNFAYL